MTAVLLVVIVAGLVIILMIGAATAQERPARTVCPGCGSPRCPGGAS